MWGMRRLLVVVLVAAAVLAGAPAGAGPVTTAAGGDRSVRGARPALDPGDRRGRRDHPGRRDAVPATSRSGGASATSTAGARACCPARQGSAVLAGHTWSQGPGVFDDLGRLRPGNHVVVGRNRFEVTRVRRVSGMTRSAVAAALQ